MLDQSDIEFFARAYSRRYGAVAPHKARDWALSLREAGDEEGYGMWMRVAHAATAHKSHWN